MNFILFRDDDLGWYHFCFDDVITFGRPDLCIGASMGGYAALLFGAFWKTRVVSFGPQTVLSVKGRQKVGDGRWPDDMRRIQKWSAYPELMDLEMEGDQYRIVYSRDNTEDRPHAERMRVKVEALPGKQHNVAGTFPDGFDWKTYLEL